MGRVGSDERPDLQRPSRWFTKAMSASDVATQRQLEKFTPLYVWKKMEGVGATFEECKAKCDAKDLIIPCITSFDMNQQMRAQLNVRGIAYAWVGHLSDGSEGRWVDKECQDFQANQFAGDFFKRVDLPPFFEVSFGDAEGCAVQTVQAAPSRPSRRRPASLYIKDKMCDGSSVSKDGGGVVCVCQGVLK